MWDEFPDWQATYGFVVRRSPYTGPSALHVDHGTGGPARAVVRFQARSEFKPDDSATQPVTRGGCWSWLLPKSPAPTAAQQVYFTSFLWYDSNGKTHQCTRQKLCTAFRRLVADWQELFTLGCAVYSAWEEPFLDEMENPLPEACEEVLARENELYSRIKPTAKEWGRLAIKMFWEAELFAQHLSFFCEMEDTGQLPDAFKPYLGEIGRHFGGHFADRIRLRRRGNRIDDWALRMAHMVNERVEEDWPRRLRIVEMRSTLKRMATEILEAKGYIGEKVFEKHHTALKGRRHRIPPPKE